MNSRTGNDRVRNLADALRAGSRRALAKAITLVESTRMDHRKSAEALLGCLAAETGAAWRIGISGAPGVGKSTFIEAFGQRLLEGGHRLAVLAVDPSSALSGGSILGDKTRMETLSANPRTFIRPSPAGSTLGGVARHTRDCIILCEAAGFDRVLVETVGIGQSESAVAAMTDMFIVLLPPAGGDELQGIKRGIMERVDLVLVNKADGEMRNIAGHTAADYRRALSLLRGHRCDGDRQPTTHTCSALTGEGLGEILQHIEDFMQHSIDSGERHARRAAQAREALWSEVTESLLERVRSDSRIAAAIPELERDVVAGVLPPRVAAARLLENYIEWTGELANRHSLKIHRQEAEHDRKTQPRGDSGRGSGGGRRDLS